MKEITRTLVFVGVACVSVAVAAVAHFATKPNELAEFERVGKEFYPEFTDPTKAASLQVIGYDEDTATSREFNVDLKDGQWRIRSVHNYPADAEDQLHKTATSVVGILRGALAGRRESDHEKFGVIDPADTSNTKLKGRGHRVKLTANDESILVDYIIGNPVENEEGQFYVRRQDEKETYISKLSITLSTKFEDWIEADLLKLNRDDLVKLVVDKYSVEERGLRGPEIVGQEVSKLTRKDWQDDWKLDGLKEETEELNADPIREMVNALDDVKIVGVRPKPRGIGGDLSVDSNYVKSQSQLDALVLELRSKGFFISGGKQEKPKLVANDGELMASTNQGVVYTLRFGEIFTGSPLEIEVGFSSNKKGRDKEEGKKDDGKQDETGNDDDADPEDSSFRKSRYLFVTTHFDETLIPDKPTEPVEPQKPAGPSLAPKPKDNNAKPDQPENQEKPDSKTDPKTDAPAESDAKEPAESDDAATSDADTADDKQKADSDETADGEDKDGQDKPKDSDADKKDPQAEYKKAELKYLDDLKKYATDLKAYNQKIEDGRKTVTELNERFAGWYYVISAESFENLRLAREDLIKPIEKSDDDLPAEAKKPGDDQPAEVKKPTPQDSPEKQDDKASPTNADPKAKPRSPQE